MSYIDLYLEKLNSKEQSKQFKFNEILEQFNSNVIVILGAPGSGKSSILKNYQESKKESVDIYNVKNFIELEKTTTKPILFLDGLDEFRNTSSDKVFVIEKLGSKISSLSNTRVVISCREMDWYGDDDKNALKDEIKTEVEIYRILPLNYSQQLELATNMDIDDSEKFVESLSEKGLISNPQMFVMMADLYIKNPKIKIAGKSELYKEYIKYTRENNPRYTRNKINILSEEETFKFGGYLATFYIFSSIDRFDEIILESIANTDFSLDKLNSILNTNLFMEQKFSHRTIAEYLAGNYLANNLLHSSVGLDVKRVKSLFTDNNKIPTELRGTYAWLCSISKNHELIAVDPYYQAIHGDNALFDIEQKKEIVLDIKQYAQTSPWFYKFNHNLDLQGFYDTRLEAFFVQELKEAIGLENHYLYFICAVLESAKRLGDAIRTTIKSNIIDNSIPDYYRDNLISLLKDEYDFLVETLNKIKDKDVIDNNDYLKESILWILYPSVISSKEIVEYLKLYVSDERYGCYFLQRTPEHEKRDLVVAIHQFCTKDKYIDQYSNQYLRYKFFLNEYFYGIINKYDNDFTANDIYTIIKDFKSQYYDEYQSIEFESYSTKQEISNHQKQKLANDLYQLYVKDRFNLAAIHQHGVFWGFEYFFNLKYPNNQYETLLGFMDKNIDKNINEELFFTALSYAKKDQDNNLIEINQLSKLAKKYKINEKFQKYLNPPKTEWQIENENFVAKKRQKDLEELEANEEHFEKKSDEEIQQSFSDLYWVSKFVYFDKEKKELNFITQKTYERLKEILRTAIYSELIEPELLTIQELAKQNGNNRNIDTMYYAALVLNNDLDVRNQIKSDVILKYFYINSLLSSNFGNINNANFHAKVGPYFALNTLKEYIFLLVSIHANELENVVMNDIDNETDIEILQDIVIYHGYYNKSFKDGFIDIFMKTYNFDISKENLTQLKSFADESNKITIEALECFIGEECEEFSMAMAIAMYEIFSHKNFRIFNPYPNSKRASMVSKMMGAFNTEESIKSVNGFQSQKNVCADFLTNQVLKVLKLEECEELLQNHINDIWTNQIKHAIDEKKQAKIDAQGYGHYPLEYVKDFLLKQSIISEKDFFEDVCIKLKDLITKINTNRDNQKDRFYNSTTSKDENACRDIIFNDLKLLHQSEWLFIREAYEANDKRVDINIKYKNYDSYEVQIECKKDKNPNLFDGIQEQLINQYLYESSNIQYGIYFIFYFGDDKREPEQLLEELKNKIPSHYENKIEIILLDLKK